MTDSNEFSVEAQQEGGCWKPASVCKYSEKENLVCVYLRESPGKEISLSLEKVRWPRKPEQAKRIVLRENAQVEYYEKHNNFINNDIYSWITGEVIGVNKENCILQVSEKENILPNSQLFAHDPKRNFRDQNVKIYTSCIELKTMPLNLEILKSICKEVHALTVIENEEKLCVLSIDSYTSDLCSAYQKKQRKLTEKKKSLPEDQPNSGTKLYTHILEIDDKFMGLAVGYRHCNINRARSTEGIKSIKLKDNSFTIVATSTEAFDTVTQLLDVISVVEEIPLCNKKKAITVKRDSDEWGLQQVKVFETDSPKKLKVNVIGRRKHVDRAINFLRATNMLDRLGEKNNHRNPHSFQTLNFTPYLQNNKSDYYRSKSDSSNSYKRNNTSASQDSEPECEFSPLISPPETFSSSAKIPGVNNANNDNTKFEQSTTDSAAPPPDTLYPVPYRAKPKTPDNVKSDTPEILNNSNKPTKIFSRLHKQNSEPNGYGDNCSAPPVQPVRSSKYDPSNTKSQARPKTSGRTSQHNPKFVSCGEFLPSTRWGGDEYHNREPERYQGGKGGQVTRGDQSRKYSQQCKKYPSETNSPLIAPNEQRFPAPQEDFNISHELVFTNSDNPTDEQDETPNQ